ncbi:hypothetical protein JQ621_32895 [Bradyrhizobium manausense]|uniref:hypothetical protein n=1 Tax=Bradyrhizobium manausense TaxID=989370 RepID=UPI001BA6BEF7|nr:hypothetical protein [Bradyrhizobium manausense]MBR1092269.1 hypothetical protein [Bradyrhizobium manausense]
MRWHPWPGTADHLLLIALTGDWLELFRRLSFYRLDNWAVIGAAGIIALGIVGAAVLISNRMLRRHRISTLLREEVRLEQELPAWRDAHDFLARFKRTNEATEVTTAETFIENGFGGAAASQQVDLAGILPSLNGAIRARLGTLLREAFEAAQKRDQTSRLISRIERLEAPEEWAPGEYALALANIETARADLPKLTRELTRAMDAIERETKSLRRDIASKEERLVLIQRQLGEFLSHGQR